MPETTQAQDSRTRAASPQGFFKALFSRQRAAPANAAPVISAPAASTRHPLQDQFEALQGDLDWLLQPAQIADATALQHLAQRDKVLRAQLQQALSARMVVRNDSASDAEALTAALQTLLAKVQQLKRDTQAEAQRAPHPYANVIPAPGAAPVANANPYVPLRDLGNDVPAAENPYGQLRDLDPPASPNADGHFRDVQPAVPVGIGYSEPEDAVPDEGDSDSEDDDAYNAMAGNRAGYGRRGGPRRQTDEAFNADLQSAYGGPINVDVARYGNPVPLGGGNYGGTSICTDAQGHKLVIKHALDKPEARAALVNEAKVFDKLKDNPHPNIVTCHGIASVGDPSGPPGLVLEYVEGATANEAMAELRTRCEKGEITVEQYWSVVRHTLKQMLAAAKHLADMGIAHNDLRFDNVMIEAETGQVKVIDLGIAANIGARAETGLPIPFVAPELLAAQPIAARSDTYMVGGSAYVMGEQRLHDFGLPTSSLPPLRDVVTAGAAYHGRNGVPIQAPGRQPGEVGDPPAGADPALRQPPPGTPQERFNARYAQAQNGIAEAKDRHGVLNDTRTKVLKGASLAEALSPLLEKARLCGETHRYEEGLGILEEVSARLEDAKRAPGRHQVDTLYTDFINKTMAGDPTQRMSSEEALNHPFLASTSPEEDEATARALLSQQLLAKTRVDAIDHDASAKQRRQWLATLEHDAAALRAYLPEQTAQRDQLLAGIRAQDETEAGIARAATGGQTLQALLADARQDKQARDQINARIAALNGQVQAAVQRVPASAAAIDKCLKSMAAMAKPGGPLDKAQAFLAGLEEKLQQMLAG